MNYVALDIETTGLNTKVCNVLSIGLVVDNAPSKPVEKLPAFEAVIKHDLLVGEPHALAMNAELLWFLASLLDDLEDGDVHVMGDRKVQVFRDIESAAIGARDFLCEAFGRPLQNNSVVLAGRSLDAFDLRFLPRHLTSVFHRRVLDVSSMAMGAMRELWEDRSTLPNTGSILGECAEHTAIGDARQVVKMVRKLRSGLPSEKGKTT
jgi:oligoribonuclease (3'-5' exoribonuclease)